MVATKDEGDLVTNPLPQPAAPAPNIRRGIALALLGIPLSIAAFAIVGLVLGPLASFTAIAIPMVIGGLYAKGAGGLPSAGARVPFCVITLSAMVVGTLVGLVAGVYNTFSAVGGDGGVLGSAFQTTVRNQFANNPIENVIPILFGFGLGVATMVSVLRGNGGALRGTGRPLISRAPVVVDPAQPAQAIPRLTSPTSTPPPAAPRVTLPGILLNGKPLDQKK
jgi:hypothetical protein